MEDPNDAAEASASTDSQKSAPAYALPTSHFYSIEYPGYVRPESVSKAVHSLGGQSSIDRAFRRSAPKEDSLLELNLRPDNPFSHPLPGDLVPTNNILLKVVKRKLKRPPTDDDNGDDDDPKQKTMIGEYTAVAVGVIPKTARFRSEQLLFPRPHEELPCAKGTLLSRHGRLSVPTRSRRPPFQTSSGNDRPGRSVSPSSSFLPSFSALMLVFYPWGFSDGNSGGHPKLPFPWRKGGLYHR